MRKITCSLIVSLFFSFASLGAPPTITRINPIDSSLQINTGETIEFKVFAQDSDGNLEAAEWYAGEVSKNSFLVDYKFQTLSFE